MRIIVCGSRGWALEEPIRVRLAQFSADTTIVHGAARGADSIAASVARAMGLAVEAHPADWARFGRAAGHRRNAEMLAAGADLVIAFRRSGPSPGTDGMVRLATRASVPVEVYGEMGLISRWPP